MDFDSPIGGVELSKEGDILTVAAGKKSIIEPVCIIIFTLTILFPLPLFVQKTFKF